jgi:hypothetical protein
MGSDRINFAVSEDVVKAAIGVCEALTIYLTVKARRDQVETDMMEIDLEDRRIARKLNSANHRGFHEQREG